MERGIIPVRNREPVIADIGGEFGRIHRAVEIGDFSLIVIGNTAIIGQINFIGAQTGRKTAIAEFGIIHGAVLTVGVAAHRPERPVVRDAGPVEIADGGSGRKRILQISGGIITD